MALLVTLKGLPLTYNRDLQEDKEPVFDAVDTLRLALPAMRGAVTSLVFDADALAAKAADGFALATDLAEALVGAGVPFRAAHERVGRFVAECERAGRTLQDSVAELGRAFPELASGALVLDPERAVQRRDSVVGPAPKAVRAQLEALRAACAARVDGPRP
jgi:argininosuccinate lyase